MKRKLILVIIYLTMLMQLNAKVADVYINALKLYQDGVYKEAYSIIYKEANRGNQEAQYLLAYMFEEGLGVAQNEQNATYWYKQSSSKHAYIIEDDKKHQFKSDNIFINRIKNQMRYSSNQKAGT